MWMMKQSSKRLVLMSLTTILTALTVPAMGQDAASSAEPEAKVLPGANPEAVERVLSGEEREANALWWGFDEVDSTAAIQGAIDSGAPKVVVPFVGKPWIIMPITLRGNLELVFEPGVLVLAKRGEYHGGGDSLFRATDCNDIVVRGYGATLRMWKKDYQSPEYKRAEWRMGLSFNGCRRVVVEGVRIESTGGDGLYLGTSGGLRWCEDVVIRDCVSHDNHRQGLSVIGAQNLLVENCVFSGTRGTPPEAGIDLEPDSAEERLVNCVIRNCVFENNAGHAILVYLNPMRKTSHPVSILFENCHSRMGNRAGMTLEELEACNEGDMKGWSGMSVGAIGDDGPQGEIVFRNCTSDNTGREGVKVFDKSALSAKVRFENCRWSNAWQSRAVDHGGPRVPVLLHVRQRPITDHFGGVEFVNCEVFDRSARPAVRFESDKGPLPLSDISGKITLYNPAGQKGYLGADQTNVSLEVAGIPERQ